MRERQSLYFELLGSFSYGYIEDGKVSESGTVLKTGRKTRSFLQYFIIHHERSISSEELLEEFWPGHDGASADTLRRMLFKIRKLLKNMFPEQENLLLTLPGCYVWNPEVCLELDTRRFEMACMEAGKHSGEEQERQLLLAVSLYKGDFLLDNDNDWTMGLRQYYRALYLDACRALLLLLGKKEKWTEILGICEQAYRIDFAVEDFTVCAMEALIAMGQPEQAIEKYEAFKEKMLEELGLPPTGRAEQMYILAMGLRRRSTGAPDIFKLLCEENGEEKAFFCTFEMFQGVVALERRHLARTEEKSALAIVGLEGGDTSSTDMRRLERILSEGLRAGDPVARLGADSYIFMLTGADTERARLVTGRLDRAFHKTYRHSKARLTYHIAPLWPEQKEK
ncbi:MAG: hypothetical protein HFI67_05930 [Lachnospiraceae bacterium]|jgi:DNA-binding SARP family transcriptional activator|nr:hypothetical protein [Lachnospiraceae bacterium]